MRPADNPNRPCEHCGCNSIKAASKGKYGIKYSNLCNKCKINKIHKRTISKCSGCGCEKEPDWYYYCKSCIIIRVKENNVKKRSRLSYEEKIEIKEFCEEAERSGFIVDILGINRVITLYSYVSLSDTDDYLTGGEQLGFMWNFLYDYYKAYIKGSTILQLRFARLYRVTRKSMKPALRYINFKDFDALKTCTKCGEDKLGSEFYWSPTKNILTAHCKSCAKKFYQRKRTTTKKYKKQDP
jgi:hypothetical protein